MRGLSSLILSLRLTAARCGVEGQVGDLDARTGQPRLLAEQLGGGPGDQLALVAGAG
jgi:hypothetical protein